MGTPAADVGSSVVRLTPPAPPVTLLAPRLQTASRRAAQAALLEFGDDASLVFAARDAGAAVELLAKAYLADQHPVLLVDRTADLDTLLHLAGLSKHARAPFHALKSIGAHEACVRVARLLPDFNYVDKEDQRIFHARNAAVHLGIVGEGAVREALLTMVRLMEPLLVGLDINRGYFYGEFVNSADSLLDESLNELQQRVAIKIQAAKTRLAERLALVFPGDRPKIVAALAGVQLYQGDVMREINCPACEAIGWLSCTVEDGGEPVLEYEQVAEDDFRITGYVPQVAWPDGFYCSACGLDLVGHELEVVDMSDLEVEVDARDYEPGRDDLQEEWL
jgi:hypothetical protein